MTEPVAPLLVDESEWAEGDSPYGAVGPQDPDATVHQHGDSEVMVATVAKLRVGSSAMAWAKAHTFWHPSGMCQQFTRSAFEVGPYYGTATLAFERAVYKHYCTHGSQVPAALPTFWTGGSHGAGHAAVSLGNGLVRSTDWPRSGSVGTARIDDITRAWGLHFRGYTHDINRVNVYRAGIPAPTSVIDLSNVVHAARTSTALKRGVFLKKVVAAEVGAGSMDLRSPVLGAGFRARYKLVQAKYLQAGGHQVTSTSVDGIPGRMSLEWLGRRHQFSVTS